MRLAHLSDLHFGREDPVVVDGLLSDVELLRPDVIAISGDLTQRAGRSEFAAARAFIESLPAPAIVVAGNHDVPLFDLVQRLTDPYRRFVRELALELQPRVRTDRLAAVGLNTARGSMRKSGRLNRSQIDTLERAFASVPAETLRVIVTHHPFVAPPGRPDASVVGRAPLALEAIERAGVDLLLSGHRHVGHSRTLPVGAAAGPFSALVVLAGTACSRRYRGEHNSYNVVEGDRRQLTVTVRAWEGRSFGPLRAERYVRRERAWVKEGGGGAPGGDNRSGEPR